MKAKDVMTPDPAWCNRDTNLREVAELMVDNDCGEIRARNLSALNFPF